MSHLKKVENASFHKVITSHFMSFFTSDIGQLSPLAQYLANIYDSAWSLSHVSLGWERFSLRSGERHCLQGACIPSRSAATDGMDALSPAISRDSSALTKALGWQGIPILRGRRDQSAERTTRTGLYARGHLVLCGQLTSGTWSFQKYHPSLLLQAPPWHNLNK